VVVEAKHLKIVGSVVRVVTVEVMHFEYEVSCERVALTPRAPRIFALVTSTLEQPSTDVT
jgi:hypothetical protein